MDIKVPDFIKEKYNLIIYVGIDIDKFNYFAAAISLVGEISIKSFKFSNDHDGFYLLLSNLAPFNQNNIRKPQTNKADTFIIANTLMMQDYLRFFTLKVLNVIKLKELGTFRQNTIIQHTRLKIQLTVYIDQFFLEPQYCFKSSLHQNSVYAFR